MKPWEILLRRITGARRWPIPQEAKIHQQLRIWAALRENDETLIRQLMKWPNDRPLMIDNLPEKIASAFGDLLFGEEPQWQAANDADTDLLAAMTEAWADGLVGAEETCASEGEVWWRLSTQPTVAHPILTWHSRLDVIPMLHGRTVLAVAFVSKLPSSSRDGTVWRHIELHGDGIVLNLLFRGRDNALGDQVALTRHPETDYLPDVWNHGVPMLAGRIVNRWGRRPDVGLSVYDGVWQRMLGLNEATTIGRENMRLTAKKRAVVPASVVKAGKPLPDQLEDRGDGTMVPARSAPTFDLGEDVLINDPLGRDDTASTGEQFRILEYSFEAAALIEWMQHEVETICQRCDIVPQFIGSGDFGSAPSGTALRVRLIPTVNAGESRGRAWDAELPDIAQRGQLLEAEPVQDGGLGNDAWTEPGGIPALERGSILPIDEAEVASRHAVLRAADLLSIETSLRERYPEQPEEWFGQERDRILADVRDTVPSATFGP